MTYNQKVHDYAVKYLNLYLDLEATEHRLNDGFSESCFDLKFQMDVRYITHWSYGEALSAKENRQWFIAAFYRLVDLTELLSV